MKTGKLNRLWDRGSDFFNSNNKRIKMIIAWISIIIAIILLIGLLNQSEGGIKGYYTYNEQEYIQLENLVKENIFQDPFTDLETIKDPNVTYTCNYNSKTNNWTLRVSKDGIVVDADISYREDGTYDVSTSYQSKVGYFAVNTVIIIGFVFVIGSVLYIAIWGAISVIITLFWLVCLGEKAVILIKKIIKNKKNNSSK